jgi:hypothetical protein
MTENDQRPEPFVATQRLWAERYPSASMLFCGGSVVRGEGFLFSDLDVVVVFHKVANAWRESFEFAGWPVEVFAHDAETLAYFVAQDCARGRPSLAQMVAEALVVPVESPTSRAIQAWAAKILATPPGVPALSALTEERYWLTDLLNDFRDERGAAELRAVACQLYSLVSNFVLRTRGQWLGSSKTLPVLVQRSAPEVSQLLEEAFETFFKTGDRTGVVRAVQKVLEPFGGELFDGYRSDAPANARVPSSDVPWTRA